MGLVKNLPEVEQQLGLALQRYKYHSLERFKACVWEVFTRILEETPQYSGLAVSNWNLSIGAPDYSFDDAAVEQQMLTPSGHISRAGVARTPESGGRMKGHPFWIEHALSRNRPKLEQIQLDSRVFITNAARGDTDHGRSDELYLESLQDPGY